jgi:hypothetical protein
VALLHIALGLDVDFPRRTVTVRPAPGLPFGPLRVEGIRVGTSLVAVSVSASGEVAVAGLPAGFTLVDGWDEPGFPRLEDTTER